MSKNVADNNDRVAVQVGRVLGRSNPKPEKPAASNGPVEVDNICTGNATVGQQVDEIRGDFRL